MPELAKQYFFIFIILLFIAALYFLSPILTPFLLGALLAYLFNPLVKKLEIFGIPHLLSVIIIFVILICLILLIIMALVPLINKQITLLIETLPQIVNWVQSSVVPWIVEWINPEILKPTVPSTLSKTSSVVSTVLSSGYMFIGWIVNLVLTPVITFYLLCDWDSILQAIKSLLPQASRSTIIKLVKECDSVLGAFFRGQLLVMLALCLIYGLGLTFIGLRAGFMLGVIGGILSIVPYLGSIFVVISASIMALIQFGYWQSLLWVWGVFFIGQIIESYALTPYLVGGRIGLHPVAVIFAIMAGGTLFGFFGILLALPAAAVLIVLARFALQKSL